MENIHHLLPQNNVLDIGCGAGRLSLMCARYAKSVTGIDMSRNAIELAKTASDASRINNVNFETRNIDDLPNRRFDIILLSEVIEHLENPEQILKKLSNHLEGRGVLVVSCPAFINFRGSIWMVLQELFQLLMSPSDLRQIYPHHMSKWCGDAEYVIERKIGLYYNWAWAQDAVDDLKQRIRLAFRDKKRENQNWSSIDINFEALDQFLEEQVPYQERMMCFWINNGFLLNTQDWSIPIVNPQACVREPRLLQEMTVYLRDRLMYYSQVAPLNEMGAGIIYFLRKNENVGV